MYEPTGDDAFLRRSSWNAQQINANLMANQPAPAVVDLTTYVASAPTGDDKFIRRASWTKEQLQTSIYASVDAPPVVVVDDYAGFIRHTSGTWYADQIQTVHAC